LPFYETNSSKGIIKIDGDSIHRVQISLWDIYNNNSQVTFEISGAKPVDRLDLTNYSNPSKIGYNLIGNNLVIRSPLNQENLCAYVYSNRMRYQLDASYRINQTAVFLWDMDQGLPDSLLYGDKKLKFSYKALMPGGTPFNYFGDQIELQVPNKALFDTVFLTYDYKMDTSRNREEFTLCKDIYPIRKNITVTLKPSKQYSNRESTSVYALDKRGNPSYKGGEWNGDKIKFKTRNWGTFSILTDSVMPEVKALILNKDQLVFRIKDSLSGISKYELDIDGKWVLMNYDYKKNLIRSEKLDPKVPFDGKLQLRVTDNAGNTRNYSTNL